MASRRQRQVAELLHEEISQLIQHDTRDPRLGFVTVTGDADRLGQCCWLFSTCHA
jgi:ribosome-binding factor A